MAYSKAYGLDYYRCCSRCAWSYNKKTANRYDRGGNGDYLLTGSKQHKQIIFHIAFNRKKNKRKKQSRYLKSTGSDII